MRTSMRTAQSSTVPLAKPKSTSLAKPKSRSPAPPKPRRPSRRAAVGTPAGTALRVRAAAGPEADQDGSPGPREAAVAQDLWRRWQICVHLLDASIRKALRTEFHTTPPRFTLMAQLASAPEGLKMKELSRRMMVTGGNVTSVTDQLVDSGWVVRVSDAGDRRACKVCLTPLGQRQLQRMSRQHEAWVMALFASFSDRDRAMLYALLGKVKDRLEAGPAPTRLRSPAAAASAVAAAAPSPRR